MYLKPNAWIFCFGLFFLMSPTTRADFVVSNLDGSFSGAWNWGVTHGFWTASKFSTGQTGYAIDDIDVYVENASFRSDEGVFLAIRESVSNSPGNQIGSRFQTSTDLGGLDFVTFTPSGLQPILAPNTDYFLMIGQDVVTSDANPVFVQTTDLGSGTGVIHLGLWGSTNQGTTWSKAATNVTIIHGINGSATSVPEPSAFGGLAFVAVFAFAVRRRIRGSGSPTVRCCSPRPT